MPPNLEQIFMIPNMLCRKQEPDATSCVFGRNSLILVCILGKIHDICRLMIFSKNQLFQKILSGMSFECQTVWPQIRPDILLGLISVKNVCKFVCLFCCFTSQVNSYGHCGTVSSPNHTFSLASLNKQLTSTLCTYFRL